jgi:hypothetical protein
MNSRVLINTQISEAVEIADQMMPIVAFEPPTWSKDAPTDPGWFWFQPADLIERQQPIRISRNAAGHLRASKAGGAFYPIEELKGLWWSERINEPGSEAR